MHVTFWEKLIEWLFSGQVPLKLAVLSILMITVSVLASRNENLSKFILNLLAKEKTMPEKSNIGHKVENGTSEKVKIDSKIEREIPGNIEVDRKIKELSGDIKSISATVDNILRYHIVDHLKDQITDRFLLCKEINFIYNYEEWMNMYEINTEGIPSDEECPHVVNINIRRKKVYPEQCIDILFNVSCLTKDIAIKLIGIKPPYKLVTTFNVFPVTESYSYAQAKIPADTNPDEYNIQFGLISESTQKSWHKQRVSVTVKDNESSSLKSEV